jgi:hypothetical protein
MKLSAVALVASSVFGQVPDITKTLINGLSYGGSGCPQNSVAATLSQDLTTFTMIFDKFIAETGPGMTSTSARRNCQITVDLRYPEGWSYSIVSVDYRGYVSIPAGLTATQSATYYFSGNKEQSKSSTKFVGPFDGDYLNSDTIATSAVVWSKCGSVIPGNINAAVSISGDKKIPGLITVDSVDGKVEQIYAIQWKKC